VGERETMKKNIILALTTTLITATMFTGCGTDTASVEDSTEVTAEATETHEHVYAEEVTAEATCEEDGVKTFTCECGDSYTEAIPATGHTFVNYVYNDDATSDADGTETATCENCDVTDTRTAEGTMLAYTYTDMTATKYAKQTVNVRSLPTTDGEKVGSLSLNDAVTVTGKCNETGWYRIEYSNDVAYVSDSYLVDNKIETQAASSTTETASNTAETSSSTSETASSAADTASSSNETTSSTSTEDFINDWVNAYIAGGASEEEAAIYRHALEYGTFNATIN
jgi:uncharacterized protein YgiM (DUF1202 family)